MKHDRFLKLYLTVQSDLLAYILCMGVDPASAEDVLQDAAMIMMRKLDRFKEGTNFRAWAYAVVRFEILKKREWQAKQPLRLGEEALDHLESLASDENEEPVRLQALSHCMRLLPVNARRLVNMRFESNLDSAAIARRLKRPVDSIYTTLSRIRKTLQDCILKFEQTQELA